MGALDGLAVLDLSRILAGPFCTQLLSDLGATVWKVEPPWGEDTRRFGPPFVEGESAYYLSANRGKKSVAVDLKDPRGQGLVRGLAQQADVLLENFKAGDLAQYGLDYESVAKANPRLIYASITGFGHTGPRSNEPGLDVAVQGLTGIMSVTGEPEGPPTKVGVAWIDVLTGLTAAVGILSALHERERSGEGQSLDLSLFDVGLMSMVNQAQIFLATEEAPGRLGNAHPQIVPYEAFAASDGWLIVAVVNDRQFRKLAEAIGQPDLAEDERFSTNEGRVEHRHELVPKLAEIFRQRTKDGWLALLEGEGVPVAPVYDVAEAMADPQAAARGVVWEVAHPKLGRLPLMASALQHMSRTPARPHGHPPLLGEHTREVLTQVLGKEPEEIDVLEREGVVMCGI